MWTNLLTLLTFVGLLEVFAGRRNSLDTYLLCEISPLILVHVANFILIHHKVGCFQVSGL